MAWQFIVMVFCLLRCFWFCRDIYFSLYLFVRRCFSGVLCLHREEWMEGGPACWLQRNSFFLLAVVCVFTVHAAHVCWRTLTNPVWSAQPGTEDTLKGEASRKINTSVRLTTRLGTQGETAVKEFFFFFNFFFLCQPTKKSRMSAKTKHKLCVFCSWFGEIIWKCNAGNLI